MTFIRALLLTLISIGISLPLVSYSLVKGQGQVEEQESQQVVADATVKGIVSLDGKTALSDLNAYLEFQPREENLSVVGADIEAGQFSTQLPAGTYGVWVYLSGTDYAVTTIQPFQELTLKPGASESLIITVKKRDAVIEGTLRDAKGNAVTGVPVKIYAETGHGIVEEAEVDTKTGRYQLSVYSGVYRTWTISYSVGNNDQGFIGTNDRFQLPVAANSRVTQDFTVYLADSEVKGVVLDGEGKPIESVGVFYTSLDAQGQPFNPEAPFLEGTAITDEAGKYEIGLPAGTYRLSVSLQGFINPPPQTVKIAQDKPGTADFKFLPVEATITGQVLLDGKGVTAMAWGWSDDGASVHTSTNPDGTFVFSISKDLWHVGAVATVGNKYYVAEEVTVDTKVNPQATVTLKLTLDQEFEFELPPEVTRTFEADQLAVISLEDGTKITVPAGAIAAKGKLTLVATPTVFLPVETDARPIGLGYDLQVRAKDGKNITKFRSDVFIAIPYTPDQLKLYGLSEDDLVPSYFDEKRNTWVPVKHVTVDRDNRFIVIATDHFTKFALITRKPIATVANIPPLAVRQVPQDKLKIAVAKATKKEPEALTQVKQAVSNRVVIGGLIAIVVLAVILVLVRKHGNRPPLE